ncbi:hypothetical protein RN001_005960 [Aquatica leii]|uniref:Myb-like domain-containing protein n=1 Tax=Aquatica leii TaxID=1421715 RepID=A0AAN7PHS6_9COLE|nr:hypothetical protein RN001_005960 [Aquatica leii]
MIYVAEEEQKSLGVDGTLIYVASDVVMTNFNIAIPGTSSQGLDNKLDDVTLRTAWVRNDILKLINLFKKYEPEFKSTSVKNDKVWKQISNELLTHTAEQCKNKFKYLKQKYIEKKDNMKPTSSGARAISFEYFELFDEMFGKDPNVTPKYIASSTRGRNNMHLHNTGEDDNEKENDEKGTSMQDKKSAKIKQKPLLQQLTTFNENSKSKEESKERRHQEQKKSRVEKIMLLAKKASLDQPEHDILPTEQTFPVSQAVSTGPAQIMTMIVPNFADFSSQTTQYMNLNQMCEADNQNPSQLLFSYNNNVDVDINNIVVVDENLVPLQENMECDNDMNGTLIISEVINTNTTIFEENVMQEVEDKLCLQNETFLSNSDVNNYCPKNIIIDTNKDKNLVAPLKQNMTCLDNNNTEMNLIDAVLIPNNTAGEDCIQKLENEALQNEESRSSNSDIDYQPNSEITNSSSCSNDSSSCIQPTHNTENNQTNAVLEKELTKKGTLRKRKKNCNKILSGCLKSTGNLKKHLQALHPHELLKFIKKQDSKSNSVNTETGTDARVNALQSPNLFEVAKRVRISRISQKESTDVILEYVI